MSVQPKDGEYFKAEFPSMPMIVYGKCIKSDASRPDQVTARCFSEMCPQGESGSVPTSVIFELISEEEFESARRCDWPR
jgi:hypothetical protein